MEHAQHIGGVDAGVVRVVGVALLYSEEEPAAVTGGECDARQTGTDGAALLYAEQKPVHKDAEVNPGEKFETLSWVKPHSSFLPYYGLTLQHAKPCQNINLECHQWEAPLRESPPTPPYSRRTHLASFLSSRWNLLTRSIFFIRWKAMQESGLPSLTASR